MYLSRYLSSIALATLLVLPFNSCSKDDDEPSDNKSENSGDVEQEDMPDGSKPTENNIDPEQLVSVSGKIGGQTYVDLGLSVKWATYNVGTNLPYMEGSYFAWGETTPKVYYGVDEYKWGTLNSYTKYCTDADFGVVDGKKVLEPEDDAATVQWGENWRMPTKEEMIELYEGCDWKWTTNFNHLMRAGLIGTSKKNGKIIFLPAAGHYYDGNNADVNVHGFYWTSSIFDGGANAYIQHVFGAETGVSRIPYRHFGQSVRAVVK